MIFKEDALPFKNVMQERLFDLFLKEVFNATQDCIYLIRNTLTTVLLWNIIKIYNNCLLF